APHDVQHAGWQAGVVEHTRNGHDGAGRIFGALQNDGATCSDSGADLAYCLIEREIPGGESSAHAHGFTHDVLVHVGAARGNHATVDTAAFFGVPVGVVGTCDHFADRFRQRLALVESHVAADLLGALAAEVSHLAQDFGAFHGRTVAPGLKGTRRRIQGAIEVGLRGVWQLTNVFVGSGIEDVLRLAAFAAEEFTIDIQAGCFVHFFLRMKRTTKFAGKEETSVAAGADRLFAYSTPPLTR